MKMLKTSEMKVRILIATRTSPVVKAAKNTDESPSERNQKVKY